MRRRRPGSADRSGSPPPFARSGSCRRSRRRRAASPRSPPRWPPAWSADGATVDVVRCGDVAEDVEDPLVVASLGRSWPTRRSRDRRAECHVTWPSCSTSTASTAALTATTVVDVLDALDVPIVVVAHTVVQRTDADTNGSCSSRSCDAADAVVVMTETRPTGSSTTSTSMPAKVVGDPPRRGDATSATATDRPAARATGLRAVDVGAARPRQGHRVGDRRRWRCSAMSSRARRTSSPAPPIPRCERTTARRTATCSIAALAERVRRDRVSFDDTYRDLPALTRLIRSGRPRRAAVRLRRPGHLGRARRRRRRRPTRSVATAFPHAVELLGGGAGIVVPQRDPAALADGVRSVLDRSRRWPRRWRRSAGGWRPSCRGRPSPAATTSSPTASLRSPRGSAT